MSSSTHHKKFNKTIPTFHGLLVVAIAAFISGTVLFNMTKTYADETLAINQVTTSRVR